MLISQDNHEIYLTFAEYDAAYVEYLRDNSSQDSSKTAKRPPSFMRMNQFGPWDTTISEHMKQLGHIVLAFTIQQSLRETKSEFGQLRDTEVGKAKSRSDDDWFEKGIRSLRIT